jgi:pilus assembly protein CpaB
MSLRTVLIVVLALVCGVSAVLFMNSLRPQAAAATVDMVPVVVAAADVTRGHTLTSDHLKVVEWPKERVPAGVLSKTEDACDRVTLNPLTKDEPIFESKLAPRGSARGMAALIRKGMRAFTIQTPTLSSGVGGFILPGNKVDVLLTVNGPSDDPQNAGPRTTTLLQNVEVLAVDQRLDAPAENKVNANEMHSVTLQVTPEQVAMLNLGQSNGQLHLSLRNPDDEVASNMRPATLEEIAQFVKKRQPTKETPAPAAAPPAPPAPPEPTLVRTLRGSHEGEVTINAPARKAAASPSPTGDVGEAFRRVMESIKGK